jgi:hypothetical protein
VLVISLIEKAGPIHVAATRDQLVDFVLGAAPLPGNTAALADSGQVLDRGPLLPGESLASSVLSKPLDHPYSPYRSQIRMELSIPGNRQSEFHFRKGGYHGMFRVRLATTVNLLCPLDFVALQRLP